MVPFLEVQGYERALIELTTALNAVGVPYERIEITPARQGNLRAQLVAGESAAIVSIVHAVGTTNQQRAQLDAVLAAFSFTRRERKSLDAIRAEVKALNPVDRTELFIEAVAYLVEAEPEFALRIGKAIDGDKTKPRSQRNP